MEVSKSLSGRYYAHQIASYLQKSLLGVLNQDEMFLDQTEKFSFCENCMFYNLYDAENAISDTLDFKIFRRTCPWTP